MNLMFNQIVAASSSASSTQTMSTGSTLLWTFLPLVALLAFFYFFVIRPQKKKDKESQQMRDNVQIGDEIMTVGGIVGIVVRKSDDTIVIETGGDKSKLRVKNWAVQENLSIHDNTPTK